MWSSASEPDIAYLPAVRSYLYIGHGGSVDLGPLLRYFYLYRGGGPCLVPHGSEHIELVQGAGVGP